MDTFSTLKAGAFYKGWRGGGGRVLQGVERRGARGRVKRIETNVWPRFIALRKGGGEEEEQEGGGRERGGDELWGGEVS